MRSKNWWMRAAGVAGLATLALAGCSGASAGASGPATTRAPTTTLAATATTTHNPWKSVTNLNTVASIAPAQLRTQFKTFTGQQAKGDPAELWLRRSEDYGVTYHGVSLPAIPGGDNPTNVQYIHGEQSPLDPRVYFLTVQTQQSCANSAPCQYQYVTMNGSSSWQALNLPVHGVLGVQNDANSGEVAQGQRLYGVVTDIILASSGVVPPGRLVTSVDGGLTWSVADAGIFAANRWIYDFAVTPTGSTVVALAGQNYGTGLGQPNPTLNLWRSDDAGATWRNMGAPPAPTSPKVRVAAIPQTGKTAIYVLGADAKNAVSVFASVDGGATWPSSYTFHIAADSSGPGINLFGSFADGAVAIANYDNTTLAWAPGEATPTTIFPAPPGVVFFQSEMLTPPSNQGIYTLWIVSSDPNGNAVYSYASAQ